MILAAVWHFTKFLKDSPDYKNREFKDGFTAAEHHSAWTKYYKEYIRQRAKKGLFVEMADDSYNQYTIKGLYNLYDFAEDEQLQKLAGDLLTLYYATWAQEQIDGVRGGGKSRLLSAKDRRSTTGVSRMMWYYAKIGGPSTPSIWRFSALMSDYRIPKVVLDIMVDVEGRGEYEIYDRALGLAAGGYWTNPHYRLNTDYGNIIRYSYVTPDFIMGLPMVPLHRRTEWIKLSSQGRWQGIIFAGDMDARIFVQTGRKEGSFYNPQWGIQRKGTMITQRLKEPLSSGTVDTRVWFSNNGLSNRMYEDGWVFVEAKSAYAAVRPGRGSYTWTETNQFPRDGSNWTGEWMTLEDEYSPVIIEVARKEDYKDYEQFRKAVRALPLEWRGVEHEESEEEDSIWNRFIKEQAKSKDILYYKSLNGDEFLFYADYSSSPRINGRMIRYSQPDYTFNSPFIKSKWDSGIVTISKGDRELVLDFTL